MADEAKDKVEEKTEVKAEAETTTAETATAVADPADAKKEEPKAEEAPAPLTVDVPDGQRLYESLWLIDPNLGRENLAKVLTTLKDLITKSGGHWVNGDKWDERRLAYPVKKKKRGLYVLAHFTSDPANIIKLEKSIKLEEAVLRVMITKDEDGISLAPPSRSSITDRDDRGGRGGRDGGRDDRGGRDGGRGGRRER